MPRVFYGNFDFEHGLATAGYNRSRQLERMNAELIVHLLALAADGDRLFCDDVALEEFLVDASVAGFPGVRTIDGCRRGQIEARLVPWGCSKPAVELATSCGWSCEAPATRSVARANSRQFSFEIEQRRAVAIPGAAAVDSLQQLESAIITAADIWKAPTTEFEWLLKAEFGMSGRERVAGRGVSLNDSQASWICRRIDSGGQLFFEPRVRSICELSSHWCLSIPKSGRRIETGRLAESELIGTTQLLVDQSGQYVGSIPIDYAATDKPLFGCPGFYLASEMFEQILRDARQVTDAAGVLGYHGPISVDSMVYRGPDGEPLLRSIQDVNARLTMGRIALEWCRRFGTSNRPAWLLAPIKWLDDRGWDATPDNPLRRLTSPRTVARRNVKRVGLVLDDPADLQDLLSTYL